MAGYVVAGILTVAVVAGLVAGWFVGENGISAINNASQVMQILTQIIMGITTGGNIIIPIAIKTLAATMSQVGLEGSRARR